MYYTYRKMARYAYEPPEPDMPHWCVTVVYDDDEAQYTKCTSERLHGEGFEDLTEDHAMKKAEEMEAKMAKPH